MRRATPTTSRNNKNNIFLSTLSLRRATPGESGQRRLPRNFYPRSPCGERLFANFDGFYWWVISIHALLAESDDNTASRIAAEKDFYPRSPCGERLDTSKDVIKTTNFYPRSPCGERRIKPIFGKIDTNFYPRSPCGERQLYINRTAKAVIFLSTLSLRRATHYDNYNLHCVEISIHALLAESDDRYKKHCLQCNFNFYPRSPCGERLL